MNLFTALAIFFVVFWLVFLAALPFGVRGQWEHDGEMVKGSEPGAPVKPNLLKKVLWALVIAAVISAVLVAALSLGLIDIADLPGPESYWE